MTPDRISHEYWQTSPELPQDIFLAWQKPNKAFNPTAIVATLDPDGAPHTAPFGSLRAVSQRTLRFATWRGHETYTNICSDDRVEIFLLSPPGMAVSVRGRAKIKREIMEADPNYAVIDVDIDMVKNDMVRRIVIQSAITIHIPEEFVGWFEALLGELDAM
ncbi:MAG: pyridoxamine 5'-phosphate oxidase family protein [Theionarchaea archaeon]|nr:pyridoxamine 5'-phosphate oxidase family protein [Theionarchaea archaeon]MBU7040451.1 pyridoxamine 5'-phosphate oxidase family protein [Theionarchaea archaeon]